MSPPPTAPLEDPPASEALLSSEGPTMSLSPSPDGPPLVDLAVLHELEQQVDDRTTVLGFVRDFTELWHPRFDRLSEALRTQDHDSALDALLSVKSASAMIGATRLVEEAEKLENAMKRGVAGTGAAFLPILASCGDMTLQALHERYVMPSGGA